MSPAPRTARVCGAAAIKEGLHSLIFSFSNHILLEQRDLAELSRPQSVACAGQGGEGDSRLPGCETPMHGLRRARSHQNPPPKALSVHDPAARASRGPTRPSAAADSQEASASKRFIACLRWVDHPAPIPGHGRWGAPTAWHEMPKSLAAPRARGFHTWLAACRAQLPSVPSWRFAVTEQHCCPLVLGPWWHHQHVSITAMDRAAHPGVRRGPRRHQG